MNLPLRIVAILSIWLNCVQAQTSFENLSMANGLSHDFVLSLCEDTSGFLWVGTYRGLQRYDGNELLHYNFDEADTTTLSNNVIQEIFRDKEGRLWFATEHGLNLFHPTLNSFKRYYSPSPVLKEYNNHFRSIVQDKEGTLWLASYGGGLFSFHPETNVWKHFYHKATDVFSLPSNYVNTVFFDRSGTLWIGTESGGLCCFDKDKSQFVHFCQEQGLSDNTVTSIVQTSKGIMYIGTWRGGLNAFDPSTRRFLPLASLPVTIAKPATIRTIKLTEEGMLWLGTQNGLVKYNTETQSAERYQNNPLLPNSLAFNYIWSLYKDSRNILWVGTFGGGLCRLDPLNNRFTLTRANSKCGLVDETVLALLKDSQERMWVASVSGGVHIYKRKGSCMTAELQENILSGKVVNLLYEDKLQKTWCEAGGILYRYSADLKEEARFDLSKQGFEGTIGFTLYTMAEDKDGNLWMGGWNTGLLKLAASGRSKTSYEKENFQFFRHKAGDTSTIANDIVWSILSEGNRLWIGAGGSLILYDPDKGFKKIPKPGEASVFTMYRQNKETIWLATGGNGLFTLNPQTHQIKEIATAESIKNHSLHAIHQIQDQLWISSDAGLYRLSLKNNQLFQYTTQDGLASNSFWMHASCMLSGNHLLFGSTKGLVEVDPSKFETNTRKPKALISDIKLFDKSITLEHGKKEDHKLSRIVSASNSLELSYSENVISLFFSSIQFTANAKTQYAYRLEGFDKSWYYTPFSKRQATYTNLNPGHYVFQVKVSNSDGIWSDPTSLEIVILPPWWQTIWFRVLAAGSLLLIIWGIFHIRTRNIKMRNKLLEHEVHQRTLDLVESNELLKEQNEEVVRQSEKILEQQKELIDRGALLEQTNSSLKSTNNLKDMLFSVIAHDIRNPVHNLRALIKMTLDSAPQSLQEMLRQADGQTKSLESMTTSLLDWAIFQSQEVVLEKEGIQLSSICQALKEELQPLAQTKKIELSFEARGNYDALCDKNALKTVLRNIISNALKFTHTGGKVTVLADANALEETVTFTIADTGIGMEEEKLRHLFQFSPNKKTRGTTGEMGSGLGLVFSYELNKLNGGEIEVESKMGSGTTFRVTVPGFKVERAAAHEPIQEIIPSANKEEEAIPDEELEQIKATLKGNVIFLVDDDEVLRSHLNRYLCDIFEIFQFGSAEEALKETQRLVPDLMIIDLNLPGISGLELVKQLKSSDATSHIACFILSSETRPEWMVRGFEFGADAYLTKPLDRRALLDKIVLYFAQQEKKIQRYLFESDGDVGSITDNPINKAFLEKMVGIIEEHLANPELNADMLCAEMGMSRSSLYRKLKSLTSHSVNDFIRNIRFKKSLELLKERQLNISQVAYEVGFSSLSYFTSSFKKHFGFSPSDLQRKR